MTQQFQFLFSPIKLGPITASNRIMWAPHAQALATKDCLPSEEQYYYFVERAKGGVGIIVLGASHIMHNSGQFPFRNLVTDERAIPRYKRIAEGIHNYGGKVFAQLSHQGRQTDSRFSREPLWAPSPIPCPKSREVPKEMEKEDFEELIKNYIKGALVLKESGFDGAEIYTAHGYLLSEFLSPHTNKRTDGYGGSLENRLRLHKEIIRAVRDEVGKDFALGLRINGDDLTPGGLATDDLCEAAKILEGTGELAYISVSASTYYNADLVPPDMSFPAGVYVPLAAAIREVVSLPVVCVGHIVDPVHAEKILQDGQADIIAMTRQLIADAEWVEKAREGRLDDIRQCVACNQGCVGRTAYNFSISCIQNPAVGHEKEWGIDTLKTAFKKRVMVVGGGPGGMEAALITALRGHDVTLYEMENELGGQLNLLTKNIKSKEEMGGITRHLSTQIRKLGVRINLGVEVTPELVYQEEPDVVIVATGSTPQRTGYSPAMPDIEKLPGVDQDNVLTYWDVLRGTNRVGQNVVMLDERSDLRCAGTAEFLADNGKKVQIITCLPYVGVNITPATTSQQNKRLYSKGVIPILYTVVKAIEGNTVVTLHIYTGQEQRIENVETIVLVPFHDANNGLYRALKGKVKELYAIGDCVAPRNCIDAIFEAHKVARKV